MDFRRSENLSCTLSERNNIIVHRCNLLHFIFGNEEWREKQSTHGTELFWRHDVFRSTVFIGFMVGPTSWPDIYYSCRYIIVPYLVPIPAYLYSPMFVWYRSSPQWWKGSASMSESAPLWLYYSFQPLAESPHTCDTYPEYLLVYRLIV